VLVVQVQWLVVQPPQMEALLLWVILSLMVEVEQQVTQVQAQSEEEVVALEVEVVMVHQVMTLQIHIVALN
tara:strand:+ start:224 stop:436 length:213 start_codon:yes stop_codon:yes gene_type:complete